MSFDTDDLAGMEEDESLVDVIVHEMGHVPRHRHHLVVADPPSHPFRRRFLPAVPRQAGGAVPWRAFAP